MNLERLFELAAIAAALGGAAYFFVRGSLRLLRRNPELSWRRTSGRIVESDFDETGKTKTPTLRYVYDVDGAELKGTRIAPIEIWGNQSATALAYFRMYHLGRSVSVYYDPEDPLRAVLEPEQQPVAAAALLAFAFALVIFAFLVQVYDVQISL